MLTSHIHGATRWGSTVANAVACRIGGAINLAPTEVCSMLVHLMLELYGCDRELLSNEPLLRRVLDEYPARVDMERVSPVHLYQIETSNPLDAGLSGFVVIAQSHISVLIYSWLLPLLLRTRRMNRAPVAFVVDHYPIALS
jgi:hypothetical protein